jgi:FkbH-like protein
MSTVVPDMRFRCPQDLLVTPTPLTRVMTVGSCLMAGWPVALERSEFGCPCDFFLVNNTAQLPAEPPRPVGEYDFQVIQIPLGSLLPESSYFRLAYADAEAYEALFEGVTDRLSQFLAGAMRWNLEHGLLTFVCNFLVPQQNPMGRLLPRYDLRNFVYFVERLNQRLDEELRQYTNTYLFDLDQLVGTFGRKYFQDDVTLQINHASALTDTYFELDQNRLEPASRASALYPARIHDIIKFAWAEIISMYRTLRQIDMVKLVVVDIDDTMWRGVAAESSDLAPEATQGWPLGLAEALGHLKRRGVLLGLLSSNDEDRVTAIWNRYLGTRLSLDDFAVRKINWNAKADNLEEMLNEVNLLPKSVVYIDDNPVERAAICAAFPGVRAFGPEPLLWRRILLWSPETQVPSITAESSVRTAMVQAQVERETQRKKLSRGEFLASLDLEIDIYRVNDVTHPKFPRTLELINKTNQFNTTGKRWTSQNCAAAYRSGTQFYAFDVTDRFTAYGLVGVVVVEDAHIAQFVMSCRVAGLDVEIAALAEIVHALADSGARTVTAALVHTDANLLCRDLFERCGFENRGDVWALELRDTELPCPTHIRTPNSVSADELLLIEPV